jgi:hypothetical protein
VTTLTEFGVLAKIGVNDAGLGVMLNMLHHSADEQVGEQRIGFPVHVLLRTLLEDCTSVDEARDLVRSLSFSASSALTVVDRGGDAASFETFPEGVGEVKPEAGLLVRTNHFVSAEGEAGCQGGSSTTTRGCAATTCSRPSVDHRPRPRPTSTPRSRTTTTPAHLPARGRARRPARHGDPGHRTLDVEHGRLAC